MSSIESFLLDHAEEMIWTVDRDLVLTSANQPFWSRLAVLSAGSVSLGQPLLGHGFWDPKVELAWRENYGAVLAGEGIVQEHRIPASPNRAEEWVEFRLVPIREGDVVIGVAGFGQSITARRKAELRLKGILNVIPDLLFEHTVDGRFLSHFASSPELLAARPEEFLGKTVEEVLPAPVAQQFLKAYRQALNERRTIVVEYSLILAGKEVFFRAKVVPFTAETLITVTQDISLERELTLEASRAKELESLGLLAQGTSKEIDSILATVAASVAALRQTDADPTRLDAIENAVQKGGRFVSELLKVQARGVAGANSQDWKTVLHPSLRALLVDDDDMDREIFGELLEVLGCETESVARGELALELLAQGREFDFVLLDMNMPGLGGPATLRALRKTHPRLPVIVSTGLANQQVLDLVAETPFVELMTKPFQLERLKGHLSRLGGEGKETKS